MLQSRILPKFFYTIKSVRLKCVVSSSISFYTSFVAVEFQFYNDLLEHRQKYGQNSTITVFNSSVCSNINKYSTYIKDISNMTTEEVDVLLLNSLQTNYRDYVMKVVGDCSKYNIIISNNVVLKIFESASETGNVALAVSLQNYCLKLNTELYNICGEFLHFIAKAQCMKGNSDKGLVILQDAYEKHIGLRNLYRNIFRYLIKDSILNRSEASVVTFKKYVLLFSEKYNDFDPLVYLWYICWSSDWFANQELSKDLLQESEMLRNIIKNRSLVYSIYFLNIYNEDAVIRLLQMLLKYKMLVEYSNVIEQLYNYKKKNNDSLGCAEILKNCEIIGVSLPNHQISSYETVKLLVDTKTEGFKFKF